MKQTGHGYTKCYAKTEINIINILMVDMDIYQSGMCKVITVINPVINNKPPYKLNSKISTGLNLKR